MARIRHIALLTKDTEKLSEFYKSAFGLKEVARSGEPTEHGQAIYVSDGHINLAILPARNRREGIYHFGMEVEDVKDATKTALLAGATGVLRRPLSSIQSAPGSISRWVGKFKTDEDRDRLAVPTRVLDINTSPV